MSWKKTPSSEYRFWLYDLEGDGMMYFQSEEDRNQKAKEIINEQSNDNNGWPEEEEMNRISGGIVTHQVTMTNKEMPPETEEEKEERNWEGDWEFKCDYEFLEISPQPH